MHNTAAPRPPSFASLVQQFFTEYLVAQRAVSPCTVACYRDALMLFLDFADGKLHKAPTALRLVDIQPDLILAFLDHLEHERHNSVRSRNLRLTGLRAFLKFAGRRDLASLHVVERSLAVPMKRFERPMLGFLTREEMLAVLGQPGSTWSSQRDHLLLAMLYNTGARVSEIIGVRVSDVVLEGAACLTFRTSGDVFRLNFPGAVRESGERAIGRLGNGEQAEELALQIGEFGVEQLHGMAGLRQPVALGKAEQA
jgi:site-specific recombinase XerD